MSVHSAERVAAIYDVHGNLPALDAVLREVARAEVDLVVFGGDYAWGPQPRQVVDRIDELVGAGAVAIRGNADREVASRAGVADGLDPQTARVNEWCSDALDARQRAWLGNLPPTVEVAVDGCGSVLFCHASPRSDEHAIVDVTPDDVVREFFGDVGHDTVVVGHTHLQFRRRVGDTEIVGPGSVGLPFGAPGAYWALIGPEVQMHRISYDYRGAAAAFERSGGPDAAGFGAHIAAPPSATVARQLYG